jgi:thiamine monophosphate synthase
MREMVLAVENCLRPLSFRFAKTRLNLAHLCAHYRNRLCVRYQPNAARAADLYALHVRDHVLLYCTVVRLHTHCCIYGCTPHETYRATETLHDSPSYTVNHALLSAQPRCCK